MELAIFAYLPWLTTAILAIFLLALVRLHRQTAQMKRRQEALERQIRALQATTKGMGQVIAGQRLEQADDLACGEIGLAEKHLMARLAEHQGLN